MKWISTSPQGRPVEIPLPRLLPDVILQLLENRGPILSGTGGAGLIWWICKGSRASPREDPSGTEGHPSAKDEATERLQRAQESYQEVLKATKHEDDKVGRFIAALAFLVAGALVFSQQADVLAARYDLGIVLPLPAISLAAFLVFVTLAVFLYVLGIAAPLTAPPASRSFAANSNPRSRLFFLKIAEETSETWRQQWECRVSTLRDELIENYQDETLNLAYRAYAKRNRSTEASVLFAVALLFFGLTMGLAVDVKTSSLNSGVYPWSLILQAWVAGGLAAFALLGVYQRFASEAVRRIEDEARQSESLAGFYVVQASLALSIVLLVAMSPDVGVGWRTIAAITTFVSVLAAMLGWRSTRARLSSARSAALGLAMLVLALGATASIWFGIPAVQLLFAIVLAVSPLLWQLARSLLDPRDLRQVRRANKAQLRSSAASQPSNAG